MVNKITNCNRHLQHSSVCMYLYSSLCGAYCKPFFYRRTLLICSCGMSDLGYQQNHPYHQPSHHLHPVSSYGIGCNKHVKIHCIIFVFIRMLLENVIRHIWMSNWDTLIPELDEWSTAPDRRTQKNMIPLSNSFGSVMFYIHKKSTGLHSDYEKKIIVIIII